jgi:hypothetical protein
MFRIREYNLGRNAVSLAVDGVMSDKDLPYLIEIIEKYLGKHMKVFIALAELKQLGYEGKHYFKKIRDQVVWVELPEYLKTEIMDEDRDDLDAPKS